MKRPIDNPPARLRQRLKPGGTWRIWWEPDARLIALGFKPAPLDEARLTWTLREAEKLNRAAEKALATGKRDLPAASGARTVEALAASYQRSVHFTDDLAAATRSSYRGFFRLIVRKWGTHRVADFDKKVMRAWYETLRATQSVTTARALIRHFGILMEHAEAIGWRPEGTNPTHRLRLRTPAPRKRSATWAEYDALIAAAEACGLPSVALAIRLSLFQGQRQTDVLAARRGTFQLRPYQLPGEARPRMRLFWLFRRSKRDNDGGTMVHDEALPAVRAALAVTTKGERTLTDQDALIWEERVGRPYDVYLFAKRWSEVREAAAGAGHPALAGLQFRDLRRTFGVLARAGGASRDDTGDVLGNSAAVDPQLNETYMPPSAETGSRAVAAIKRPKVPGKKRA